MKYIITEEQYSILKEQNLIVRYLDSKGGIPRMSKLIADKYSKLIHFVDVTRPQIEEMGKKIYPANEMASKNPKLKNTPEYRELKDKEDAYDHQLASAIASSIFGPEFSELLGKANEIKGGLRMFFKGSPSKGIDKFEQFTSGWEEDNANNQIGIELGKKYPNKNIQFFSDLVVKNIENKNYYDSTGKKKK